MITPASLCRPLPVGSHTPQGHSRQGRHNDEVGIIVRCEARDADALGRVVEPSASERAVAQHRAGHDVEARIPALVSYLGHVNPASTYWYLSASPELMELAADRLDKQFGGRP